ncbi:hypothetical protein PLESTB_000152400 [Pleodorina starrii]|uniref:Uncharacterized protein n=1 Tax=Pleodorina starrii TaxID=330485 RepID=A0A9W6EXL4_9CHLO|nr:hypothetical protein PLESTM_000451200 [Pleodorina starrii]GLC48822.1 hypothetical protein PLESTB_000152400 [Pleodorina starrii]
MAAMGPSTGLHRNAGAESMAGAAARAALTCLDVAPTLLLVSELTLALTHLKASLAALYMHGDTSAAATATASWRPFIAAAALGHAVLHVYYIATWTKPHTRQVVAMSALRSVAERQRRFRPLEVAWYNLGTGFDVATHLMLAAALVSGCAAGSRLVEAIRLGGGEGGWAAAVAGWRGAVARSAAVEL